MLLIFRKPYFVRTVFPCTLLFYFIFYQWQSKVFYKMLLALLSSNIMGARFQAIYISKVFGALALARDKERRRVKE